MRRTEGEILMERVPVWEYRLGSDGAITVSDMDYAGRIAADKDNIAFDFSVNHRDMPTK